MRRTTFTSALVLCTSVPLESATEELTLPETTVDLAQLDEPKLDVVTNPVLLEVLHYIAGPPISEDDLKVVAEAT